jgi:hypothetical protein
MNPGPESMARSAAAAAAAAVNLHGYTQCATRIPPPCPSAQCGARVGQPITKRERSSVPEFEALVDRTRRTFILATCTATALFAPFPPYYSSASASSTGVEINTNADTKTSSSEFVEYTSADEEYRIQRPSAWEQVNKAGADVLFRDPQVKKATLGVTVLPVRIATLGEFGSLEQVAEKLASAERAKESTLGVHMVSSVQRDTRNGAAYDFLYELDTTRGRSTIAASVTIVHSKLYIVNGTVPCWESDCDDLGAVTPLLEMVIASVRSLEVTSGT